MITLDFSGIHLKLRREDEKAQVFDIIRRQWVALTPEEHVRQYMLHYLIDGMQYPAGMIAVEKQIAVGSMFKRFDIVVYNREHKPWLLVECKAPEVMLAEATLYQLLNYQRTIQCNYWLLTNGHQNFCADACDASNIQWLEGLPAYNF